MPTRPTPRAWGPMPNPTMKSYWPGWKPKPQPRAWGPMPNPTMKSYWPTPINAPKKTTTSTTTTGKEDLAPPEAPTPDSAPGASSAKKPYDYTSDPALLQTQAAITQRAQQIRAQALEERKRVLMGLGSGELARSVLGGTDPYAGTVEKNPWSSIAQNRREWEEGTRTANEELNKSNLYFSSYRTGQVLPEIARNRQFADYSAEQAAREAMLGIDRGQVQSLYDLELQQIQAQQEAMQRAAYLAYMQGFAPDVAEDVASDVEATPPTWQQMQPSRKPILMPEGWY